MTVRKTTFHDLAQDELDDAAGYYEAQRLGLGQAFIDAVENAVAKIEEHPESGAPRQ